MKNMITTNNVSIVKNFYLRNGLQEMGFKYVEKDVKYEMLYVGEKLSSKVYDELMVALCRSCLS